MGGIRIGDSELVLGADAGYTSRPGLPEGGDRFVYGLTVANEYEIFTAPYRSFRLITGFTAGREQALQAPETNLSAFGLDAGAYIEVLMPGVFAGVDLNPRVVISDKGGTATFELGAVGRLVGTFSPASPIGLALSVEGDLRLADMEHSAIAVKFGVFVHSDGIPGL